jgi:proline dehydrogenase
VNILRHFLLALSHNAQMQDLISAVPASRRAARRFVAGEQLEDAVVAIRQLNNQGILATVDYLGEYVSSEMEAHNNADEYLRLLDAIQAHGLQSHVSVKLTAMGLHIGDDFCHDNVRRIAAKAAATGSFMRIDMEDSAVTSRTLDIYRRLRAEFEPVGIVLQAYLYRTQQDVAALVDEGLANVRLCKGAYDEPPTVAFPLKADVDANMITLLGQMLSACVTHAHGVRLAVASHDGRMIDWAKAYAYHQQIPRDRFEFQMLYGIRRDLQLALAKKGYTMRVYVPYGTAWYGYFMRRLAERPANTIFFLRALVGQ